MSPEGGLQRLPSLPEHSSRKGLFALLGKGTREESLRGGTQDPPAPKSRIWFGAGLSQTASLEPDAASSQGAVGGHHSRTRSLEDAVIETENETTKKSHRRGKSFTTFIRKNLGLSRPSSSQGSADEFEADVGALPVDANPHPQAQASSRLGGTSAPATPTVPPLASSRVLPPSAGASGLSCFGLGLRSSEDGDGAETCLSRTPGLATGLAPDLQARLEAAAAAQGSAGSLDAPGAATAAGPTEAPGSVDVHALARASTDRSGAMEAAASLALSMEHGVEASGGTGEAPPPGPPDTVHGRGQAGVRGGEDGDERAGAEPGSPPPTLYPVAEEGGDAADASAADGVVDEAANAPAADRAAAETAAVDGGEAGVREGALAPLAGAGTDSELAAPVKAAKSASGGGAPTEEEAAPVGAPADRAAVAPESGPVQASASGAADAAPPSATAKVAERPPRGELLAAFLQLVLKLCLHNGAGGLDPMHFIRTLKSFPMAAEFLDGGQHDCQEVLRVLMDLLHDDLKPLLPPAPGEGDEAGPPPSPSTIAPGFPPVPPSPLFPEPEPEKADRHWRQYLERDSSTVTELFGGQLQSSITCHKCNGRFTMYEPFWDLSLPLAKEGKQSSLSWLGIKGSPASISDCLTVFAADEKLEGGEAFSCETCKAKTPATKHLRLQRLPQVLVLHIKRFKYRGFFTDKLTASVSYPLAGLSLDAYLSPEALAAGEGGALYDLYAVSNHYGNLSGGHYTAMCRVQSPQAPEGEWYCFNDDVVNRVSEDQARRGACLVMSQYAYILFYTRRPRPAAA